MSFLLNLSRNERFTFERHFLSSVHSEIRFTPVDVKRIIDKKDHLDTEFKKLGFSESKIGYAGTLKLDTEQDKPHLTPEETVPLGVLFNSQSPRQELRIEKDKIVYSDYSYSGFKDFQLRYQTLFDKVSEIISFDDSIAVNKVGLKKINAVVIQPFVSFQDNLSVFNPALFGTARSGLLKFEHFKISEETTLLQDAEDKLFLLKTRLAKTQIDKVEATLDFDFVKLGKNMKVEEVFNDILPSLNQCHFDLFMWSVTDTMRDIMEEKS